MRVLAVVLALSMMLAAPTFAHPSTGARDALSSAEGQGPAPGQPQTQAPAAPPPAGGAQTPASPDQTPDVAQQSVPFQDGFKYAYINIQAIAAQSKQGQDANKNINALREKLTKQISEAQKKVQETQTQLDSQGAVLSDTARLELQTSLDRQQRDLQRMVEDAEQDIARLTERLQQEFMTRLQPVIERIAKEKQVHMIFNAADSGLVWAVPGMDLTAEVIAAFDTAKPAASGGAKPPPPAPTTPPPSATTAPPAPGR